MLELEVKDLHESITEKKNHITHITEVTEVKDAEY